MYYYIYIYIYIHTYTHTYIHTYNTFCIIIVFSFTSDRGADLATTAAPEGQKIAHQTIE